MFGSIIISIVEGKREYLDFIVIDILPLFCLALNFNIPLDVSREIISTKSLPSLNVNSEKDFLNGALHPNEFIGTDSIIKVDVLSAYNLSGMVL